MEEIQNVIQQVLPTYPYSISATRAEIPQYPSILRSLFVSHRSRYSVFSTVEGVTSAAYSVDSDVFPLLKTAQRHGIR